MLNQEKFSEHDVELVSQLHESVLSIKNEIRKIIVGHDEIIDKILIALLSRGHCLLVGVPGLAKTLLIKTIASVLDLDFKRIQFTPDLMPGDITGTEIIDEDQAERKRYFRFIKGPIFANIILADEINRTPPKTQSALLEAMQEHRVTAAGNSYILDEPFFVLATQNPIEQEGTYPLPEAQLDRFMFSLWLDYPSHEDEIKIVKTTTSEYSPTIQKVLSKQQLLKYQDLIKRVPVADSIIDYTVKVVNSTRPSIENKIKKVNEFINWGAGPRASQFLILAAKSRAVLDGRFSPNIDDVKYSIYEVLRHRIIPNFNAEAEGIKPSDIIKNLLENLN
ncbi:MAG: AAA family ATPase [Ignavibacteriales bacterium CG_4_9_14_3_um_filter_34_10]|nr:MAG: AAA family ATPase [Ignavibacteriales bacterium CG_4_9_14_3_um_filter_34_10]